MERDRLVEPGFPPPHVGQGFAPGSLSGVSCATTTECIADGSYTTKAGPQRALVERWTGTS
jgi:hypothetical protein